MNKYWIAIIALIVFLVTSITINIRSFNSVKLLKQQVELAKNTPVSVAAKPSKTTKVTIDRDYSTVPFGFPIEVPVDNYGDLIKTIQQKNEDQLAAESAYGQLLELLKNSGLKKETITIEQIESGEYTITPIPNININDQPGRKNFTIGANYNIPDEYAGVDLSYRIYKSLKVGGRYNTNNTYEVRTALDF